MIKRNFFYRLFRKDPVRFDYKSALAKYQTPRDTPEQLNEKNAKLAAACAQGDAQAVRMLIAAGANVNAGRSLEKSIDDGSWVGPRGKAITNAARNGHTEIVEILLRAGADKEVLQEAAENGHTETLKALLSAGANPYSDNGPLRAAARNGHTEALKVLLEAIGTPVSGASLEQRVNFYMEQATRERAQKARMQPNATSGAEDSEGISAKHAAALASLKAHKARTANRPDRVRAPDRPYGHGR